MSASGRGPTGASLASSGLAQERCHLQLKELGKKVSPSDTTPAIVIPSSSRPAPGHTPVGRFDSAGGHFGVLYLAAFFEGAFVETVLRNPRRRLIGLTEIGDRSITVLAFSRAIRLVPMDGAALQSLGVDKRSRPAPTSRAGFGPTLCLRIRTAQMASSTRPGTIRIRRASPCFGVLISQSRSRARAFRCSKCCPKSPRCYGGTGRVSPETRAVLG